uniref:bifunctional diguanylate cyclase/phosphodiesterase n=1 Tax=Enterocloster asparagiformis TaxID=333367 RepID=UPI0036F41AFA
MKQSTKKMFSGIGIAAFVMVALVLVYAVLFYRTSQAKMVSTLAEISDQSAKVVRQEVEKNQMMLESLAILLAQGHSEDIRELVEELAAVDRANNFKRMGIVREDGTGYATDGSDVNARSALVRERFKTAFAGSAFVSDRVSDLIDGEPVTVYGVPFTAGDGGTYALFGTYSTEFYEDSLSVSTFGGNGYSYIIKEDGECVSSSRNPASLGNLDNFYKEVSAISDSNAQQMNLLREEIAAHKSGSLRYEREDGRRYVYYQPLEVNQWYLLSIVPSWVVEENVNGMLSLAYTMMAACLGILALMAYQIWTIKKRYWEKVEDTALTDAVTGHASFAKFRLDVQEILSGSRDTPYALVCFNVRMFQYINDLHGFAEGDRILRVIADYLSAHIGRQEACARLNADRFAALLSYRDKEELRGRVKNMIHGMEQLNRSQMEEMAYDVRMTAGIYQIEDKAEVLDKMLDWAKAALSRENMGAIENCGFYDTGIRERMVRRKELENHFEEAMSQRQFEVYYQPKYDVKGGRFYGAEALVRWNSPAEGMIPPGLFVPVFESNSMIIRLDEYIFEQVCRQIRQWLDRGFAVQPVSVNISRLHLYQKGFVERYLGLIRRWHVPPGLVELELTETVMFDNEELLGETLQGFRREGVPILMDDFGSGYSSIQLLRSMPIDNLKIDKGLVDDSTERPKLQKILSSVIGLAQSLHIQVTAEGVETKDQYDLLKRMNVDYIQGYYCAKPMPCGEYEKLVYENTGGREVF